jgi:hypothetical protein
MKYNKKMNSQSLNGLIQIDANQITTDTIEVNETYTNKNITMEYSVVNNALETFNSKDFNGLLLKNQMTGLHDAELTDLSMKQDDHLKFSNDGNYLILPDISIGSNGFTIIATFSSNNSPNYGAIVELSNEGPFNQNITMYILYGNLYINIHGVERLLDDNTNCNNNTKRTIGLIFYTNNNIDFYVDGSFVSQRNDAYPSTILRTDNRIGSDQFVNDGDLTGYVYNFRFFTRALTGQEILDYYKNDAGIKYNINLNPTNFVGVKQPNPQYSLDVNGSIRASQYYDYNGNLLTFGLTGDTGHTGYVGATGSTGSTGATGPKGNGFMNGTSYGNISYWDGTTYALTNEK